MDEDGTLGDVFTVPRLYCSHAYCSTAGSESEIRTNKRKPPESVGQNLTWLPCADQAA
jgi:hypothetical protein